MKDIKDFLMEAQEEVYTEGKDCKDCKDEEKEDEDICPKCGKKKSECVCTKEEKEDEDK